jgi:hypothetical protein
MQERSASRPPLDLTGAPERLPVFAHLRRIYARRQHISALRVIARQLTCAVAKEENVPDRKSHRVHAESTSIAQTTADYFPFQIPEFKSDG